MAGTEAEEGAEGAAARPRERIAGAGGGEAADDMLGGLTPGEWDALSADAFYSSSRWLRFCARTSGSRCRAVAVRLDDGTAGAVPVTLVDEPLSGNYGWNGILTGRGLPGLADRGVLVGPPGGYQTHLLRGSDDPRIQKALLGELRALAADRGAAAGSACVAMYLPTDQVRMLRDAGVEAPPVLLEPDAWFDVPAGGWEPWLASMNSRYRHRIRRDVAHFEAAGYTVRRESLAACVHRLPPLAVELARKLGYDPSPERFVAEFGDYVAVFGDAARVVLCEDDAGALVGFCMYFVWGDTIWLRWSAFDYPRLSGGNAEYFNVGYYRQIHLAGEIGATRLHAGKKAIEAKVLRGARLRPLWLLDLGERSPLSAEEGRVREHNARLLKELEDDRLTGKAIADRAEWAQYC